MSDYPKIAIAFIKAFVTQLPIALRETVNAFRKFDKQLKAVRVSKPEGEYYCLKCGTIRELYAYNLFQSACSHCNTVAALFPHTHTFLIGKEGYPICECGAKQDDVK